MNEPDVKIIDGTWVMPGTKNPLPGQFIPGAQLFDIDAVADPDAATSHMLPPANIFAEAMREFGIKNNDHVIIYDRHGIRAAPRVWWMFQMFGQSRISILNGGLPAWIKAGFETANTVATNTDKSDYQTGTPLSGVSTLEDILAQLGTDIQILDARARGRFDGTVAEPRKGLRSGHIPGSQSLPYTALLTTDNQFKSNEFLLAEIAHLNIDLSKSIITSCGSGVTAAVLAFALHRLGAQDVSLYDGSWTEWGASDAPISTSA